MLSGGSGGERGRPKPRVADAAGRGSPPSQVFTVGATQHRPPQGHARAPPPGGIPPEVLRQLKTIPPAGGALAKQKAPPPSKGPQPAAPPLNGGVKDYRPSALTRLGAGGGGSGTIPSQQRPADPARPPPQQRPSHHDPHRVGGGSAASLATPGVAYSSLPSSLGMQHQITPQQHSQPRPRDERKSLAPPPVHPAPTPAGAGAHIAVPPVAPPPVLTNTPVSAATPSPHQPPLPPPQPQHYQPPSVQTHHHHFAPQVAQPQPQPQPLPPRPSAASLIRQPSSRVSSHGGATPQSHPQTLVVATEGESDDEDDEFVDLPPTPTRATAQASGVTAGGVSDGRASHVSGSAGFASALNLPAPAMPPGSSTPAPAPAPIPQLQQAVSVATTGAESSDDDVFKDVTTPLDHVLPAASRTQSSQSVGLRQRVATTPCERPPPPPQQPPHHPFASNVSPRHTPAGSTGTRSPPPRRSMSVDSVPRHPSGSPMPPNTRLVPGSRGRLAEVPAGRPPQALAACRSVSPRLLAFSPRQKRAHVKHVVDINDFKPNLTEARKAPMEALGKRLDTGPGHTFKSKVPRGCEWLEATKKNPPRTDDDEGKELSLYDPKMRKVRPTAYGREMRPLETTLNIKQPAKPSHYFQSKTPRAAVFKDQELDYVVVGRKQRNHT